MSKLQILQFYTGDWLKDPALRACSPLARGIWIDCLCIMSESNERGYLRFPNGSQIEPPDLARMIGATLAEIKKAFAELEKKGVYSKAEDGTIYSRRMVRDEQFRQSRAQNGNLGGRPSQTNAEPSDNLTPNLNEAGTKPRVEPSDNLDHNLDHNLSVTPSSSTTSSTTIKEEGEPPLPPVGGSGRSKPAAFDPGKIDLPHGPAFAAAWSEWITFRRGKRKSLTEQSAKLQLVDLAKVSELVACEMVRQSIKNGWTGIFPVKGNQGQGRQKTNDEILMEENERVFTGTATLGDIFDEPEQPRAEPRRAEIIDP